MYISQTLGLAFITMATPVIMRQSGADLDNISLIFVLGLFWSLKFLWAPLIDRYGSNRLGHYRGWIILFQILMILATIGASNLSIHSHITTIFLLFTLIALCSSTQDLASDGLAVTILTPGERPVGNSIQSAGNFIGFMIGGGLVLMAYEWLGWRGSLLILAAGMLIPLFSILNFNEHQFPRNSQKNKTNYKAIIRFFRRPGIWYWVVILLIFRINGQITWWLLNPFLVDSGWTIDRIGFAMDVYANLGAALGAVMGGYLIGRMGRKPILLAAMLFGIPATWISITLVGGVNGSITPYVYTLLSLSSITFGMGNTVMYTVIMDKCHPDSAATDFSLQWSLTGISAMVFGGLAMALAEYIGYKGVLTISIGVAVMSTVLIWRYDGFDSGISSQTIRE